MEAVDVGVDLDAVAGGQHGRLGDVLAGRRPRAAAWRRRSASRATRSSTATGAVLWEMPTTRTLIETSSTGGQRAVGVLALLVVGEDLQLAGEVDLAYVDALGDREDRRREVQDAA